MAWQTPKLNWQPAEPLTEDDMNRIEGNIDYLKTDLDGHKNSTSAHGVSGAIVGTSDSQTLTNKTLGTNTKLGENLNANSKKIINLATPTDTNDAVNKTYVDSNFVKKTDYEDSDVLAKIKNVDGAGSGLDADTVDGYHASYFATADHNHDSVYVKLVDYEDSDVLNKIKNVDGSGSGLDADLLDGQHADYFEKKARNITSQSLYGISTYNIPDGTEILEVHDWHVQTLTLPSAANYVGKFLYVIMTQPEDVDGASITFQAQSGETIARQSSITFNLDALSGYPPTWYNPTQDQHGFVFTAIDSTHWVVVSRY